MITRKYRLPQSVGGLIVEGVTDNGYAPGIVTVTIDGAEIQFPLELLRPVLFKQPVSGFVFIPFDDVPMVFYRCASWEPDRWYSYNQGAWIDWEAVCQLGEPQQLHAQNPGTAPCSVCGEMKKLRVDGMIPQHGSNHINGGRGCLGSNKVPAEKAPESSGVSPQ